MSEKYFTNSSSEKQLIKECTHVSPSLLNAQYNKKIPII